MWLVGSCFLKKLYFGSFYNIKIIELHRDFLLHLWNYTFDIYFKDRYVFTSQSISSVISPELLSHVTQPVRVRNLSSLYSHVKHL